MYNPECFAHPPQWQCVLMPYTSKQCRKSTHAWLCKQVCTEVCADVRVCVQMCVHRCAQRRAHICVQMCVEMCVQSVTPGVMARPRLPSIFRNAAETPAALVALLESISKHVWSMRENTESHLGEFERFRGYSRVSKSIRENSIVLQSTGEQYDVCGSV